MIVLDIGARDSRRRWPGSKPPVGEVWRAYSLKETLRGIFAPGRSVEDVALLIDRFLSLE
jgi:hypothetical protein